MNVVQEFQGRAYIYSLEPLTYCNLSCIKLCARFKRVRSRRHRGKSQSSCGKSTHGSQLINDIGPSAMDEGRSVWFEISSTRAAAFSTLTSQKEMSMWNITVSQRMCVRHVARISHKGFKNYWKCMVLFYNVDNENTKFVAILPQLVHQLPYQK